MQFVYNELSGDFTLHDRDTGKRLLDNFLDSYSIIALRKSSHVVLLSSFYSQSLSQGYTVAHYRADQSVDKRYRDLLRSMLNRANTIDGSEYAYSECLVPAFQNKASVGCLVAYENDGCVISFGSHALWESNCIQGRYLSVEKTDAIVETIDVSIPNISSSEHSREFAEAQSDDALLLISSGQDLWENKEQLYPSLIFCDSVRDQLIGAQSMHLQQIKQRLASLNAYFKDINGPFDYKALGMNARTESESVKSNKQYKQQRVFRTPTGEDRFFHWHIDFTGSYPGRIYFYPDADGKNCVIGYIGKHLPTAQFKTI